jgi:LytS/YehU family sensor histidine kinase
MNIYPLVFSNNPRYRLTRHVLFWTTWILYYTFFSSITWTKIPFHKAFFACLFEQVISTPLDMAFCYAVIYFLIPRYLYRGKYVTMVMLWLLFSILFILCFRFYSTTITPALHRIDGLPSMMVHSYSFTWFFFDIFSQINMEGCIAASIKLGKIRYIKQEELNLLRSEKQKIEPVLNNGEMKPVFLINALDKMETLSQKRPDLIPGMVRKIKNLLLYVIYDGNLPKISLEKEIKILREYIELEQEGSDGKLKVHMNTAGNMSGERISPFILLSLVENSFRQLSIFDIPNKFLNLEIKLSEGDLNIEVSWSKPVDTSTLGNGGNAYLQNIGKRLNLLYPQSHELKALIKTNEFIIRCHIDLHAAIN